MVDFGLGLLTSYSCLILLKKILYEGADMVVYALNPRIWKVEAEGSEVQFILSYIGKNNYENL